MTNSQFLRNVLMSILLLGITLSYLLVGNQANQRLYLVGIMLSMAFLIASINMWRGSRILGFLTISLVILSIVWQPMQPFSTAFALIMSILGITSGELRFRNFDFDNFDI